VLLAALAASAVTLAATLFKTNERDLTFTLPVWDTFSNAFGIAIVPVLLYFVVLAAAGMFGWLGTWWKALIAGAVGVLIGGALGYLLQIVSNGVALDGAAWAAIFGEFLGQNFPLVVSGLVSAAFVAPAALHTLEGTTVVAAGQPARAAAAPQSAPSTWDEGSAFLRIPSDELLEQLGDDADDANEQWEQLVAVFEEHGWGTEAVGGGEGDARSTLLGDAALVLGEQVIMAKPKDASGVAGLQSVRDTLENAGAVFDELEAPAVFHPADVVEAPGVLYVGVGGTTNASAVRGLRRLLGDRGYRIVGVPMAGPVPLSEALSVLPDGTKLIWREAIANPEVLGPVLVVPEPRGAAVVALSPDVIAVASAAPDTAQLVKSLGYEVEQVDISAFAEIGGTLPRLSLRSRD
jgi:dimethylargininase